MNVSRLDELVDAMAAAGPILDGTDREVALTLYRMLAEGRPVVPADLAKRAGVSRPQVITALGRWPCVFRDRHDRVIGFWGLALGQTSHRLRTSRATLSAWCAWDALFIGALLDQPIEVESSCPVTGATIRMTITSEGVRTVRPTSAVMSFLAPQEHCGDDSIATFCRYVHFFGSEEAGRKWAAEREGTFLLSVEESFELGRRVNGARFGL